ncbi:MAG: carboxypeptidase regulatory-like domain-containing protein [Acidobacteria bacterium]|nr:carboxypeptidase regulatory-like domain-containing protein [Acidobacteriota bacterium]
MRALLFLCFTGVVAGQTTGTIGGKVQDKTGGVMTGVKLTARHVDTGRIRTTTSDETGRFLFAATPVGAYELRAEFNGFRPLVRKGLRLAVGETAELDLVMEVGAVDQEVTVEADASLINTHTAELSYLVSEDAIRELPLNGRNYTDLALLQPGVIAYPHRDGGSVVAHGLGVSINGQDPRSNVYLIDGTPQNDFTNGPAGSAASTVLGVETIREFRVETNAYSAEFGRSSGGQITALSKSGTNSLHGSLYEFHRNDNFDARNFFDSGRKPEFKRNQFGATWTSSRSPTAPASAAASPPTASVLTNSSPRISPRPASTTTSASPTSSSPATPSTTPTSASPPTSPSSHATSCRATSSLPSRTARSSRPEP